MIEDRRLVEDLRGHLRVLADVQTPTPDCPTTDRLWKAVHGDLRRDELIEVLEHLAACGACAEAWRLAREIDAAEEAAVDSSRARRRAVRWLPLAAAAALVFVLISVGLYLIPPTQQSTTPVFRAGPTLDIRSLVPEDEPMPRAGLRLRWTPGPEGSLYTVRIRSEEFAPLVTAEGLSSPEYLVPDDRLLDLESDRFLWQVVVFPPEGGQSTSSTFFVRVEPRGP